MSWLKNAGRGLVGATECEKRVSDGWEEGREENICSSSTLAFVYINCEALERCYLVSSPRQSANRIDPQQ